MERNRAVGQKPIGSSEPAEDPVGFEKWNYK